MPTRNALAHPVVLAVADAPAVVGHQDGRVHDVAHQVVEGAAGAERLVAAVVAHHKLRRGPGVGRGEG